MNYKKANTVSTVLLVTAVVIGLLLYCFTEITAFFIAIAVLSMLLLIAGIVVKVLFYRCPHCQGLLPLRSRMPVYCPMCGERLGQ